MGADRDNQAGAYSLYSFHNDLIAEREPARHRSDGRRRLPKLDSALLGLIVGADRENVVALLIRQDGRARNDQVFDRLYAFEKYGDKLAIGKFVQWGIGHWRFVQHGIGNYATKRDCIRALRYRVVDEV